MKKPSKTIDLIQIKVLNSSAWKSSPHASLREYLDPKSLLPKDKEKRRAIHVARGFFKKLKGVEAKKILSQKGTSITSGFVKSGKNTLYGALYFRKAKPASQKK